MVDPSGKTIANVTAPRAGRQAIVQPLKIPGTLLGGGSPGLYTVTVGGAAGTTGSYALKIVLNAAIENEALAGIQSLESSFITLSNGTGTPQASRGAVLGELAPAVQRDRPELRGVLQPVL